MKRLVFTLCVLGFCGTASGQGYWWESDETRALREIGDRLEQLDWDIRMSNWDSGGYSGGYYPMLYPQYPRITPRMAKEAARRANWYQRGQAKKAALAARRAKQRGL